MMKKSLYLLVLSLLLVVFSISPPIYAGEIKVLDIEEALKLTLGENSELKIAQLELENARLDYQISMANNLLTESRLQKLQAELSLIRARDSYSNTHNRLINDALREYKELILLKKSIKIKEKELDLEKRLLAEVRTQVESGHQGSMDLLEQKNIFNNAHYNLEKTRSDYKQKLDEFKASLNLSSGLNLQFKELDHPTIWQISQDKLLKSGQENDRTLQIKVKSVEVAQVELKKAKKATTPQLDLKKLANNHKIAGMERDKYLEELINTMKSDYYQFEQSMEKMDLEKESLLEAKENYQIIKKQKEAGLKTLNDLLRAEMSKLNAEYRYQSAILDYYLKETILKQDIGLEPGVLSDELSQKD